MEIKLRTRNWCLSVYTMISYKKNIKNISTKIEDLTNVELTSLPKRDDWYIKAKIRTYVDKAYTNFCGYDVPKDVQNFNLLQPFLLILYWFMKTNITCKYI